MSPVPASSVRLACASSVLVALASLATGPVAAFEFGDLFRTPEQRAAARFEAGEHEALIENAPGPAWEGIGRYAGGDVEGAADAFARALEEGGTAPSPERDALLYNRATAETRAGRLDEAITLYDELIERDPEHEDALHNREVARALKALEEQGGSPSGDGEASDESDEEGERGEGGDASSESGDESGEPGDGGGDERDANAASESADDGPPGERASEDATGDDAETDADTSEPDAAREAEARAAAAAALEAERQRALEDGGEDGTDDGAGADGARVVGETRTPSEREQATEQWLRRIADDPSGLLRRRLERSHRGDYPEVGDGDEPW